MIKNQIPNAHNAISSRECVYTAGGEEVRLTPDFVRNYLVSGDPTGVTFQEIVMFMNLCKYQHLNPFLREAYLIKYGSNPATIVTGKSALEKRASRNERYRGFKAGVIVLTADGKLENRIGTLVLDSEILVGGWCDVFVEGLETVSVTVSMSEYMGRKRDSTANQQWSGKPATMIRKVAKIQALREAFPEDLEGLYSAEEKNVSEPSESVFIEPPEAPKTVKPLVEKEQTSIPKQLETSPQEMPSVPEEKSETKDEFSMILEGFSE